MQFYNISHSKKIYVPGSIAAACFLSCDQVQYLLCECYDHASCQGQKTIG